MLEIERKYKLSFPDGLDLQTLVRDHKKAATKLQKMDEIGEISQEKSGWDMLMKCNLNLW